MLSLVPVSVVNASMDTLWHRTVEIVTAIACLLMVLLIALIAIVIALDENSVIFTIVSFAWAGFGATFGR